MSAENIIKGAPLQRPGDTAYYVDSNGIIMTKLIAVEYYPTAPFGQRVKYRLDFGGYVWQGNIFFNLEDAATFLDKVLQEYLKDIS